MLVFFDDELTTLRNKIDRFICNVKKILNTLYGWMNGEWMENEWWMNGEWMENEWRMNGEWMENEWDPGVKVFCLAYI